MVPFDDARSKSNSTGTICVEGLEKRHGRHGRSQGAASHQGSPESADMQSRSSSAAAPPLEGDVEKRVNKIMAEAKHRSVSRRVVRMSHADEDEAPKHDSGRRQSPNKKIRELSLRIVDAGQASDDE